MKHTLLAIFCSCVLQGVVAQPVAEPSATTLKVLSWNIYMLPHLIARGSEKSKRASTIAELLSESDYDVIFFQEAFHSRPRKIIYDNLIKRFTHCAGPANRHKFSLKTNSGLWVFSKYPILRHQSIVYQTRHGIDAFSRKGALLVDINVNGHVVQVAGTHLQNSGPSWLKQMQCVEFFEHLLKPNQKQGVPQIICGDFNIDMRTQGEEYRKMLNLLDATDTNTDSQLVTYDRQDNQLKNETGTSDLIDYILVRQNGAALMWSTAVRRFSRTWKKDFSDLSDHYSLHTVITISGHQQAVASLGRQ